MLSDIEKQDIIRWDVLEVFGFGKLDHEMKIWTEARRELLNSYIVRNNKVALLLKSRIELNSFYVDRNNTMAKSMFDRSWITRLS